MIDVKAKESPVMALVPSPKRELTVATVETVLVKGDLKHLDTNQRVAYYNNLCESLGLNPMTRPFDYITLNDRLTLYAKKDCADQLRKIHQISLKVVKRELDSMNMTYSVTVQATFPSGREDEAIGVTGISRWKKKDECDVGEKPHFVALNGEDLANKMMRAETKAKRRATLSICGLGFMDESELDTIDKTKTYTPDAPTPVVEAELVEFDSLHTKGRKKS